MDIFDHDDGVIDQNTDRKNQRKQRYPVQGETPGPGGKQRQCQGYHNCSTDNQRLPPAQRQGDQQHHHQGRKHQLLNQRLRFFIGGSAIVTRYGHFDSSGNHDTAQLLDTLDHLVGYLDRIAARLFRDRQRHCGKPTPHTNALVGGGRAGTEPGILPGLRAAGFDHRDIAKFNWHLV